MIVELGGDFSSILTDRPIEIKGKGFHIKIEEIEPGIFLVTGLTDVSLSELVIRPAARNQIVLQEDAGRTKPIGRPHRVLDAQALDVWMDATYHVMLQHWQTYEADNTDLWEWVYDNHPDVWREFEKWFLAKRLESPN